MRSLPHQWHQEVLPLDWNAVAADLHARSVLGGFYLAGGTGLALRYGHRLSVDFDLFQPHAFSAADLLAKLGGAAGLSDIETASSTLHLQLRGIKVSFLHYPYPLMFPVADLGSLAVADPRDIACMKVDAISSRGTRRDFIDLYVTAQEYGVAQILEWFDVKYAATPFNRVHILKSMTYFRDAEQEPMPHMLAPIQWPEVTEYFTNEAPKLV